jgi:SAM-dependent methyltransferase
MPTEWYDECFDEFHLQVYGLGLDRASHEVDFMLQALDLPPAAQVLDLACGHGRHAIELARRGYAVTGLDRSRALLAKAVELSGEAGVRVEWVQEDMRAIPETWAARFDGVINVFTSWGYFEADAENEQVLQGVARALKLAGRLFLDTINHERLMRQFRPRSWTEGPDGSLALDASEFDPLRGRVETTRRIILPDGSRHHRRISVRLYTLAEVRNMLDRCGLRVLTAYGDFAGGPYTIDSPRTIVVAEREK